MQVCKRDGSGFGACACTSDDPDDPSANCELTVDPAFDRLVDAAALLDDLTVELRSATIDACATIAETVPPKNASDGDIGNLCDAAVSAIHARLDATEGAVGYSEQPGQCTEDPDLRAACTADCAASSFCGNVCTAFARLAAECSVPTVLVEAARVDAHFMSLLNAHLSTLSSIKGERGQLAEEAARALANASAGIVADVSATCAATLANRITELVEGLSDASATLNRARNASTEVFEAVGFI